MADEIRVAGVRLTSPERVLYSGQGITKRELAEYYVAVGDRIVPHLRDRPLTLVRCPQGQEKECFVQRRATDLVPAAVRRVQVEVAGEDGPAMHLAVVSLEGLLSLVQLGVLELHTWSARRDRLDRPDRLILDLDPAPDLPFSAVVDAALHMRQELLELGLDSFVKTTGGKGLHVVAPLVRRNEWEDLRAFARAFAERCSARWPDRYLARAAKAERAGRVFLDWMRNAPGATAVSAYSTRAAAGAPVSTPLAWEELDSRLDPGEFDLRTVPARLSALSSDPWEGYARIRQALTREIIARTV